VLISGLLPGTPGTIAVPVTGPGGVMYVDSNGNIVTGKKNIYRSVLSGRMFCI